ncbi:MAG: hypothetical protein ACI8UR_000537 [Natronomonas sp.]|jgi:hypothetical protein|uniref:hypothetical protein n=1 Tax=Natronomonas sp. TaxID=2184060 RepID=UPI00398A32DB
MVRRSGARPEESDGFEPAAQSSMASQSSGIVTPSTASRNSARVSRQWVGVLTAPVPAGHSGAGRHERRRRVAIENRPEGGSTVTLELSTEESEPADS